jgi:hypothetical protein
MINRMRKKRSPRPAAKHSQKTQQKLLQRYLEHTTITIINTEPLTTPLNHVMRDEPTDHTITMSPEAKNMKLRRYFENLTISFTPAPSTTDPRGNQ